VVMNAEEVALFREIHAMKNVAMVLMGDLIVAMMEII